MCVTYAPSSRQIASGVTSTTATRETAKTTTYTKAARPQGTAIGCLTLGQVQVGPWHWKWQRALQKWVWTKGH